MIVSPEVGVMSTSFFPSLGKKRRVLCDGKSYEPLSGIADVLAWSFTRAANIIYPLTVRCFLD